MKRREEREKKERMRDRGEMTGETGEDDSGGRELEDRGRLYFILMAP